MRQCIIQKENRTQVTWLDVKKTDLGRFVDLKTDNGDDKNWKLISVGDVTFSNDWINKRSRDYKNMKKMTDI